MSAEDIVARIGVRPGDGCYAAMLDAAKRGWPAWIIARAYDLPAQLVFELGGPAPASDVERPEIFMCPECFARGAWPLDPDCSTCAGTGRVYRAAFDSYLARQEE